MNLQTSALKFRVAWGMLTRRPLPVRLRDEFNLWAGNGRGERMEREHKPFTDRMFNAIDFAREDRVLDLACGEGWASRLLANRLGSNSQIVGIDIADGMVQRASLKSTAFPNVSFQCAQAHALPFPPHSFTKAFCIESFYYFESQETVLREVMRLLRPDGELFLLFCLYRENLGSLEFPDWVRVPVHLRSISEYRRILQGEGWGDVKTQEFISDTASQERPGFHDRALFIRAKKLG